MSDKDNLILHVSDPRDDGIFALETFYKLESLKSNKKSKLIMVDASSKAQEVVKKYDLGEKVAFVHDMDEATKQTILDHTAVLMVTGKNQGFSILQVEAMARGVILIANNSGSSLETIVHEYTGYLLPRSSSLWS